MTSSGYVRLEEELKRLKNDERPAVIRALAEAREHGDLSENAEYHAARERQSFIEGRMLEIEDKLARAAIIDISQQGGSTIQFGAQVKLVDEETEEEVGLPDRRARGGRGTKGPAVDQRAAGQGSDRTRGGRTRSRSTRRAARAISRSSKSLIPARSAPNSVLAPTGDGARRRRFSAPT